jgi:hypothetical protein
VGVQVDLLSIDGTTELAKLTKATGVAVMEELNGDGNTAFTVARGTPGVGTLLATTDALVRVSLDGVPVGWGVLDQDSDDAASKARDARPVAVVAPGTVSLLNDALMLYATTPAQVQREFSEVSPGELVALLIQEAQVRGALDGITWSFTDTHDSDGEPWPSSYSRVLNVGYSLRALLQDLADQGLVDYRMDGLRLDMYVADTVLGEEVDVVLEPAWLTAAPRQRTRAGKVTHLYGIGEATTAGTFRAWHEATSGVPGRRREALVQFGGLDDEGTVAVATEAHLSTVADVRQGYTVTYPLAGERPVPWGDYSIGHRVHRRDLPAATGDGLEPLRIRTMSVELTDAGMVSATLELNDVFLEAELVNKRRIDALSGQGMGIIGGPVDYGADLTKPAAPTAVLLSSEAYRAADAYLATATAEWLPVTTNEDGSPAFDVVGYEVQWNVGDAGFGLAIERTPTTELSRDGLPVLTSLVARVRAVDRVGNYSEWTESDEILTADDATAPSQPSQPSGADTFASVRYGWDGLNNLGGPMEGDTAGVQVHISTTDTAFVPVPYDPATMVDFLPFTGSEVNGMYGPVDYGTTVAIRMIAVDTAGNASPPSAVRLVSVAELYDTSNFPEDAMPDFAAYVGEFMTLYVDQLIGNAAWIGALETGTLVGGILEGTEFRTNSNPPGALGGIRLRDADGLKMWAPGGGLTVHLDRTTGILNASGAVLTNATISGLVTAAQVIASLGFATGTGGTRIEVGAFSPNDIEFWYSGSLVAEIISTASGLTIDAGNVFLPGDAHVGTDLTVSGDVFLAGGASATTAAPNIRMGAGGQLFAANTSLGPVDSGGAGFRLVRVPN